MSAQLVAAVALDAVMALSLKYPVFPCRPMADGVDAKKPRTAHGLKDAARDEIQAYQWWDAQPDSLVGIPTGAASGLIVIDDDTAKKPDADSSGWLDRNRALLDSSRIVVTASGGRHHVFLAPEGVSIKSAAGITVDGKKLHSVDVRGDGGYIIDWSAHGLGSSGEIQPLPVELVAQLTQRREAPSVAPSPTSPMVWNAQRDDVARALAYLDPAGRDDWVKSGMAIHHASNASDDGFALWHSWSAGELTGAQPASYKDADDCRAIWNSFKNKAGTPVTLHSVFAMALKNGYAATTAPSVVPAGTVPLPPTVPPAPVVEEWPDPVDFLNGKLEAPPFDGTEFPPEMAAYPLLYSRQTGFDPSTALNAALTIMAAAIPDQIQLCADSDSNYFAQARLWQLTIADPGAGKSPVQRELLGPLWKLHAEAKEQHAAQVALMGKDDDRKIPLPRAIVADVTLEKLSDVLEENPRGILLATDEFSAWLGSLDQYKGGGAPGRDRGEWLRLFDGGPHQIERVSRGSKYIHNWGASILTATTPSQMQKFAKDLPEDGLIQRFLIAISRRKLARTDKPSAIEIQRERERYARTVVRLWQLLPRAHGGVVQFAPDAKARFEAWSERNDELVAAFGTIEPPFAGHLAKYQTFALRIALTFHCVRIVNLADNANTDPAAYLLGLDSLERAFVFLDRSLKHARAMYLNRKGASTAMELSQDIAQFILAKPTQTAFQRRELVQGITSFRTADEGTQATALRLVADFGWLRPVEDASTYRKPHPTRFAVNPAVAPKFAALAERELARRVLIRERIAEHRRP